MALQGERQWDDYPSVGCADSSPDKGSQGAVEDAGPYKLGQKCSPVFTEFFALLRMTANFKDSQTPHPALARHLSLGGKALGCAIRLFLPLG